MHGELLQASTRFYPRFTLPRVRSSGFGSCASDSWRFHTTPLVNCGLLVSLRLPDVSAVSLATHTHSLARYSKRTMHTRTCASYYSSTISRALHSLRRVLFSVPSRYWIRYRTHDVFRVGGRCPPGSHAIPKARYSGDPYAHSTYDHGAVTLYGAAFQRTQPRYCRVKNGSCNTTSPTPYGAGFSLPYAVLGRSYSPHPNWFLFLRVLRRFSSPRLPSSRI